MQRKSFSDLVVVFILCKSLFVRVCVGVVDSLFVHCESDVRVWVVWRVDYLSNPVVACFPQIHTISRRVADYVSACWLGRVSKERVWRGLDLVRENDCDVVDLCDPHQLVHYAVEALLPVCKRSSAGKLCAVERDDAVDYY